MKKYLLLILFVLTLSSCNVVDEPIDCPSGQIEKQGVCTDINDQEDEDDKEDPISPRLDCTHLETIDEYVPVWCDEFDYDGLPLNSKWSYDVGGHGWGNNELQYYTESDLDNAKVENGYLTITAIKEEFSSNDYTSARLVTREKGDWLYGKIQVKAKLPSGTGTWPAIWMLPTDWSYGGWPYSGEIDIMEHVGYEENKLYSTIHTGAYNHSLGTQIGFDYTDTTLESEFHVYEIIWEPGTIKSYIDGIEYASFLYDPDQSEGVKISDAWPFDEEFHLILNIAVGGSWGGQQGVDSEIWPQEMVIDYVRVYQKDYTTGDISNPTEPTNLEASSISSIGAFLKWSKSQDDKMVKEYEIYIDDILIDTSSLNAYILEDLLPDTSYTIGVRALDFAGNKSEIVETSLLTSAPPSIDGIIEAENYTASLGVDTEVTQDVGGGLNVGWTHNGDFLEYVLVVNETGNYTVDFRVSSKSSGGTFQFNYPLSSVNLTVPVTGDWQNWETITSTSIFLEEGTHTFKIMFTSEGTNINYFEFKKVE